MKTSDIRGIIPPVITPMNNDPEQTVNHEALRQQGFPGMLQEGELHRHTWAEAKPKE